MKQKLSISLIVLFTFFSCSKPVPQKDDNTITKSASWKTKVENTVQLFGHRNWIVVADGAYPKQSNPAIKIITVDANQLEVVQFVNEVIKKSSHVQATIFLDKEMAFVAEKDAKGIDKYRKDLDKILEIKKVQTMLHEDIIKELDNSAKVFNVLIIKTNLTIPYTSVFFQLDCGYWNSAAETTLRTKMNSLK